MILWLRKKLCSHRVYFEDMKRISDECVIATCHRCGKSMSADCGLHLPAVLDGYRPAQPQPAKQEEP